MMGIYLHGLIDMVVISELRSLDTFEKLSERPTLLDDLQYRTVVSTTGPTTVNTLKSLRVSVSRL
jgi:hypothetical protein